MLAVSHQNPDTYSVNYFGTHRNLFFFFLLKHLLCKQSQQSFSNEGGWGGVRWGGGGRGGVGWGGGGSEPNHTNFTTGISLILQQLQQQKATTIITVLAPYKTATRPPVQLVFLYNKRERVGKRKEEKKRAKFLSKGNNSGERKREGKNVG